jgi:hypothetical protein
MHGTRTMSDPQGKLMFVASSAASIRRYNFATRTTDIILCGNCGVDVGAGMGEGGRFYGIVNANVLDDQAPFSRPPETMHYEHETAVQRIERRKSKWTPTEVRE